MKPLQLHWATVRNGHIVSDEPVDLPEGSVVGIEVIDEPVDLSTMDPEERAALEADLEASAEDIRQGRVIDHDEVLRLLDRMRRGGSPLDWKGP